MGEGPALSEVRRRALARFETPAALAHLLADRVLRLGNQEPGLADPVPNLERSGAPNLSRSYRTSSGEGLGPPSLANPDLPQPGVRPDRAGDCNGAVAGLRSPGSWRSGVRPCRAVDPTCGSGALLAPLAARGYLTYGVDLDPQAVRRAASRLGTIPGGRVKVGNALLDPVGPAGWEEFIRAERDLLQELAVRRCRSRFEAAEALARPVRERLAARLPAALRHQAPFCWPLEFPEVFLEGGFEVVVSNPPWDKLKLHLRECFDPALRERHESEQRRARSAALERPEIRHAIETERGAIAAFRAWLRAGWGAPEIAESGRSSSRRRAGSQTGASDGSEADGDRRVLHGRAPSTGFRGDANAYLAVLDLADALLARGGALGAIVPGGFWTDLSALAWRERLFGRYAEVATWCLEARTDAFPDIDQRTAIVVGRKVGPQIGAFSREPPSGAEHAPVGPEPPPVDQSAPGARPASATALPEGTIAVHPPISRLIDLGTRPGYPVPIALIRRTAPESLAIPPLADALDAAIVEKLYQAGPPFASSAWRPVFGREIDMTVDADLFDGVRPRGDAAIRIADGDRPAGPERGARISPLWEGKRIGAFELCPVDAIATGAWPRCKEACSRAGSCPLERRNGQQLWVDESRLGERDRGHARHARVAWRSVARADRARRLEAALIPPGYRLGNSLNYLVGDRHTLDEKLTLLALLNSLVVEWRFRQLSNNNNVNLFAIRQIPMPEGADPALATLAWRLMLGDLAGLAGRLVRSRLASARGNSREGDPITLPGLPKVGLAGNAGGVSRQSDGEEHFPAHPGSALGPGPAALADTPGHARLADSALVTERPPRKTPDPASTASPADFRQDPGRVALMAAREAARDELDAAVAHRFGLSGDELARILSGFPKLPPERIAGILSAFDRHPPGANKSVGQPETQASGRLAFRGAR